MSKLKLIWTIIQTIFISIFSIGFVALVISSVYMNIEEKKLARYGECHLEKQFSKKVDLNKVKVGSKEWKCWSLKRELEEKED